ncbi:hypothetical protein FF011L_02760 [Roseimaritima multifibrata]|uniref:PepSY domain-containing protein n=1 Tax=Roseimaritima multifibrata TaxID=1930274 RepID=A0A517M9H9_9BACT|nr:PepSY domain-containing protein [Roseimaritima multifibrata]QDS91546.1 hypothetical protein FF011L_02760 [Roseimaritima multifibrata]
MNASLLYSLAAVAMIPVGAISAVSAVGESPNRQVLSMVEIVQGLEKEGYGPFAELSRDDGRWEVEARKGNESLELTVDPLTGKVLSQHRDDPEQAPPAESMALSKLLQSVLDHGSYRNFEEVSFERRYWEIEIYKDGQKRELHVDPITAKVIADRIDD